MLGFVVEVLLELVFGVALDAATASSGDDSTDPPEQHDDEPEKC